MICEDSRSFTGQAIIGKGLIDLNMLQSKSTFTSNHRKVTLVEWLTRGPANKLGRAFGRVGSNPAGDVKFMFFVLFFAELYKV